MPNKAKQVSNAKSNINTAKLNLFKKQQQQHKVSIEKRQLREYIDCNELKQQISCLEANIIDLQRKLDDKSEKFFQIRGKYEELCQKTKDQFKSLQTQFERYNQLEAIYDRDRLQLKEQINLLNENVSSLTNLVNAKEAECGAYRKDMRTKVESSDMRRAELERDLLEVKENYLQIELKYYEMAEKENLLKNYYKYVGKLQNKIDKKDGRISQLVGKLKKTETKNKELKDSLKIQNNKIHQLQCVLNRPVIPANRPKQAPADINQRAGNDGIIQTVSISPFISSSSDPDVDAIHSIVDLIISGI